MFYDYKEFNDTRAFLITGASSGIGRATALLLDRRGFQVFAGVRRSEHGQVLQQEASKRLTPILLDVTDPRSIEAAARSVADSLGDRALAGAWSTTQASTLQARSKRHL